MAAKFIPTNNVAIVIDAAQTTTSIMVGSFSGLFVNLYRNIPYRNTRRSRWPL